MMYKKLYGSVLVLGASFVATNSVACSMGMNVPQNQFSNQFGYNNYGSANTWNQSQSYGNQACFSGAVFKQNIGQVGNGFANDDCSGRFTNALNNFREVMRHAIDAGGIRITDVSSVIVAQSTLIDVMSDVISSLLQAQQQQLGKNGEVSDLFTKLGNIFSSYSPSSSQDIASEIAKLRQQVNEKNKEVITLMTSNQKDKAAAVNEEVIALKKKILALQNRTNH